MPLARQLILSASFCAFAAPVFGQVVAPAAPTVFHVTGIVSDIRGNPVEKAEVTLDGGKSLHQTTMTGTDGRFNLGDFSAGGATIRVRRLGYQSLDMNISIGANARQGDLDLEVRELPQKLEEVLVKSDEDGRLREFSQHKNERNNFGRYFDRGEIRKRNPSFASELFRTVPGVQVQSSGFGGNAIRIRGCKPLVWMDGQRIPGAELDEVVRPGDIAGLEIYSSNAGIPPEFMDRNNGACGIIVVWTKSS